MGTSVDSAQQTARRGRRPSRGVRRVGYVFAVLFNAAFLWLVHVWPGWDEVPFLTDEFGDVLWLLDLSLWIGIGANLVYLVRDPRWLTALGGLASTTVGLILAVRIWQVFPFDVSDGWTTVFRIAVVVGIIGSAIGILVNVGLLIRALAVGEARGNSR
jgi:hypothetical protein